MRFAAALLACAALLAGCATVRRHRTASVSIGVTAFVTLAMGVPIDLACTPSAPDDCGARYDAEVFGGFFLLGAVVSAVIVHEYVRDAPKRGTDQAVTIRAVAETELLACAHAAARNALKASNRCHWGLEAYDVGARLCDCELIGTKWACEVTAETSCSFDDDDRLVVLSGSSRRITTKWAGVLLAMQCSDDGRTLLTAAEPTCVCDPFSVAQRKVCTCTARGTCSAPRAKIAP